MRLWLLLPVRPGTWPFASYDTARGFVVRAETEAQARDFAEQQCGDETVFEWSDERTKVITRPAWTDTALSTCVPLTDDGEAGVILRDFMGG